MNRVASLLAATALAACAATPDGGGERGQPSRPTLANLGNTEAPDPSPLAGYEIPRGRCGMILWTKAGGNIAPIFRSLDVTTATMQLDGEVVDLALQEQSGPLQLGMRAIQVFKAIEDNKAGLTVEARLDWGDPFPGGFYVRGGSLSVNGADGWSRILPVAGIAGCKA